MYAKYGSGANSSGGGRCANSYYALHIPLVESTVIGSSIHNFYLLDIGRGDLEVFEFGAVEIPGEEFGVLFYGPIGFFHPLLPDRYRN